MGDAALFVLASVIDGTVRHAATSFGMPLCGKRGRFVDVTDPYWRRSERLNALPECKGCKRVAERSAAVERHGEQQGEQK